jgi:hypothetical protein
MFVSYFRENSAKFFFSCFSRENEKSCENNENFRENESWCENFRENENTVDAKFFAKTKIYAKIFAKAFAKTKIFGKTNFYQASLQFALGSFAKIKSFAKTFTKTNIFEKTFAKTKIFLNEISLIFARICVFSLILAFRENDKKRNGFRLNLRSK